MTIVLDASAAIEIALNRKYAKKFKEYLSVADIVIAPETFYSEITNTFWKYANAQELDTSECENGILGCIDLVDDYITTRDMCKEVFSESTKMRHPAYDIFEASDFCVGPVKKIGQYEKMPICRTKNFTRNCSVWKVRGL